MTQDNDMKLIIERDPKRWIGCAALILTCALAVTDGAVAAGADQEIPPYPGAERVSELQDNALESRRLILGALEKVNNVMEPERVDYVRGTHHAATWHLPGETRTQRVVDYYRPRLAAIGDILFECSGRSCGSSNYWANSVFGNSVLYGPEERQHYMLARLHGGGGYVSIYVAMRGTREIYVHSVSIGLPGASATMPVESPGRFVFVAEQSSGIVKAVAAMMQEDPDIEILLTVHQPLGKGQTVDSAIKASTALGDELLRALVDSGIPPDQVTVRGLGPLAPDSKYSPRRIEILIPSRMIRGN